MIRPLLWAVGQNMRRAQSWWSARFATLQRSARLPRISFLSNRKSHFVHCIVFWEVALRALNCFAQIEQSASGCEAIWPWYFRVRVKILADFRKEGRAPRSSSVCYFLYGHIPLQKQNDNYHLSALPYRAVLSSYVNLCLSKKVHFVTVQNYWEELPLGSSEWHDLPSSPLAVSFKTIWPTTPLLGERKQREPNGCWNARN